MQCGGKTPDEPYHSFRASRSGDWWIWCSSGTIFFQPGCFYFAELPVVFGNKSDNSIKILPFFLAYSSFVSTHSFSGKGTLMLCGAALSIRRARQDADSALLNAMVIRENSSGTQEPTCELGYIPCNPLPYDATMIKTGETHYHLGPGKGYFISPCSSSHVST